LPWAAGADSLECNGVCVIGEPAAMADRQAVSRDRIEITGQVQGVVAFDFDGARFSITERKSK